MDTLLGNLLCISILPKTQNGKFEFFKDLSLNHTDPALWTLLSHHQKSIFTVVKQLLVLCPETKKKMIQWMANCLDANISRGHLWSSINMNLDQTVHSSASDSFMNNLCSVLTRLCAPLCEPTFKVSFQLYFDWI